jgi:hypothetical protein
MHFIAINVKNVTFKINIPHLRHNREKSNKLKIDAGKFLKVLWNYLLLEKWNNWREENFIQVICSQNRSQDEIENLSKTTKTLHWFQTFEVDSDKEISASIERQTDEIVGCSKSAHNKINGPKLKDCRYPQTINDNRKYLHPHPQILFAIEIDHEIID